jgi:hypothetical protein
MLPAKTISGTIGKYTSFDAGRGCPFQCSFCTIINVQGRKSRHRTPAENDSASLEVLTAHAAPGPLTVIVPNQPAIKPAIKPEGPAAESRPAARTGSQV